MSIKTVYFELVYDGMVCASCLDWCFVHEQFKSVSQLETQLSLENEVFELIEIDDSNRAAYNELFGDSCDVL